MKPAAKRLLIDHGYDRFNGARPLRRVIEDELEHEIAEGVISGAYEKGVVVTAGIKQGKVTVVGSYESVPGNSKTAVIVSSLLTVLLFLVAGWVVLNRQYVVDQLVVWQYQPSSEVAQLAERAQMNDKGTFYFYASEPQLDGTAKFNEVCKRQEENSAILGCFTNGKIFVYNISDKRLNGVEEVTAAHEMLHAVYVRLSSSEKTTLIA